MHVPRTRPAEPPELRETLAWADLEATDCEVGDVVEQIDGSVDVLETIEGRDRSLSGRDGDAERFDVRPYRPSADADSSSAWLIRLEPGRPNADGRLTGVTGGVNGCLAVGGVELARRGVR